MRSHLVLCAAPLLAFLVGCGDGGSDPQNTANGGAPPAQGANGQAGEGPTGTTGQALATVQGTFAEKQLGLDNARVVAIAENQTSYSAQLDANGDFKLELPVGFSYRFVFANQLAAGGQVKIGTLSFKTSTGISEWFGANVAGTLDLGSVTASGSFTSSVSANHGDDPPTQEDDGSAKTDPSGSAGVNICLIWPSVIVSSSVTVDDKFADKSSHSTENRDDDQTCGYWNIEGGLGIVWGAPSIDLRLGFGPIKAGANIGVNVNTKMNYAWDFSSNYTWNSSWSSSWESNFSSSFSSNWTSNFSSNWNSNFSSNWNSSFNSNWSSSWNSNVNIGGAVGVGGGVALGAAYSYESKFESSFQSKFEYGGVVGGGYVSSGWSVSSSSSFSSNFEGSACVTANSCNDGLSCVASKCAKK